MSEQENMIPYVVMKFSNGDVVLGECVEESIAAMIVRYPIHVRTAFVTNEFGVKVKKNIASKYCELAYKDEIVVQKATCNYIAPLKFESRKYYEVLVAYNFFRKKDQEEPSDNDSSADGKQEESKSEETVSKHVLH